MRIVFTTAYYPPYAIGGAEESTMLLARALTERGHEVTVVAPRLGDREPEAPVPVRTVDVGLDEERTTRGLPARTFDRPLLQLRLARAVREAARGADLVHNQALHVLPGAYLGARRAGVPVVASIRDLNGVCSVNVSTLENARVPPDCGVVKLERECIPRFLELYDGPSRLRMSVTGLLFFLSARGRSRLLDRCDAVYSVGSDLGHVYADAGLLDIGRVRVLPNIAELEGDGTAPPPGETGGPYALYAGKVSPGKGFDHLLEAVAQARATAPDLQLLVAGAASERWRARLEAADGVVPLGRVRRQELAGLYAGARFAVVPSIWPEPLPRAALEASASGKAVVATRAGGTPDAVVDGETGLLVEPRDAPALAAAMARLWDDQALAGRMGEAGRAFVRERFSADAVAAKAEALYAAAAARR